MLAAFWSAIIRDSAPVPVRTNLTMGRRCMESNAGRKPDPFEPEYCEEERQLYKLCRDDLRGPTDEDDSD